MTKIHVLADETLGGIKREFIEVERMADVGDLVQGVTGQPHKVRSRISNETVAVSTLSGEPRGIYTDDFYVVLEPTDIVHIKETYEHGKWDAERFRLVDRKAEVGERVIVANVNGIIGWYRDKLGEVFTVIDGTKYGFDLDNLRGGEVYVDTSENTRGEICVIEEGNYRVLVPVESEQSPESIDDVIASLVRRVNGLEAELSTYKAIERERKIRLDYDLAGIKDDVETWSREIENVKHAQREAKTITLDVDTLAKLIGGAR